MRDWDDIPIDLIQKADIIIRAERQARRQKLNDQTLMPVTNVDLIN